MQHNATDINVSVSTSQLVQVVEVRQVLSGCFCSDAQAIQASAEALAASDSASCCFNRDLTWQPLYRSIRGISWVWT